MTRPLDIGYTGMAFPFRLAPDGTIQTSSVDFANGVLDHIADALVQILRTKRGERFFRRGFGAEPVDILFELNTEENMVLIGSQIDAILKEWEPRVSLYEFRITEHNPDQGQVTIRVGFVHDKTQVTGEIEVSI